MNTMISQWIDYNDIRWNPYWCKRCHICVEACPHQALALKDDDIIELGGCDRTGLCQKLCPDLAIEVINPKTKGSQGWVS